ncbi:hypothetical protein G6F40_017491 [Rhizopus arrhizus]|nr:hypothetical protein G6F40_017491 [Rhizopus arrhizus]
MQPEFFERREETEDPFQPCRVELVCAARLPCGEQDVFLHRQVRKDAHVLGHIGHAHARHVGRRFACAGSADGGAVKRYQALRGPPQSHDRAQRGGLAAAAGAQERHQLALGDLQ